jgi:hypothetical protein
MAKVFLGGVPTEPDVKAIREAFPDVKPGDTISYAAVAEIARLDARSNRIRTVLGAYRSTMLREANIKFRTVAGIGLQRLTEAERTREGIKTFTKGARGVRRSVGDLAAVDTTKLDQVERQVNDHARRLATAAYDSLRGTQKEIAASLAPPKQLPRMAVAK